MKLINSVALKQEIANVMPSRTEVFLVIDAMPDAIVHCKDCKHRGNSKKCVLSAISEEKDFPLFMLDNRGDWFCADGERRD